MEYAPDGSLYDYLHTKGLGPPPLEQSIEWALQVARGMEYLHDCDIIHRDLKSPNILLSGKDMKICDFGTARFLQHTTKQSGVRGTYRWMAPEVMKCQEARINHKCDVYSYAMVSYELFIHKVPFYEIDEEPLDIRVGQAVLDDKRPEIVGDLPPYIHDLIEVCWRMNPDVRPTFSRIIAAYKNESTLLEKDVRASVCIN